jgi:hypothetical protein
MVLDNRKERRPPGRSTGASSPQEKRPGRHAREALLFLGLSPFTRCVYRSAHPSSRGIMRVLLAGFPQPSPVADHPPRTSRSAVSGHRQQTAWSSEPPDREMQARNSLPQALRPGSPITVLGLTEL